MNSCARMSATKARTVREMMPIGITLMVMAGNSMCLKCSQSQTHWLEPPGPAPPGGSHIRIEEKTITSTMPNQ